MRRTYIKLVADSGFLNYLLLITVILLSLNKISDTDAWLHLSFGKLIWGLKQLPDKEMFSYPSADRPFSYSSWLFGVIVYGTYLMFKVKGLVFLKAITVTTGFFVIVKDALQPRKNTFVAALVLSFIVIVCRHRFVLRPELFLMMFLPFSIFALNAFVYENRKYIYWLPAVHLLWANMHSSINLMFVPFGAYIVGGAIQNYLFRKKILLGKAPSSSQLKYISLFFACSLVAALISPYGFGQFSHGTQYLAIEWYKQELFELLPPSGNILLTLIAFEALILSSFILARRDASVIHFLIMAPFVVLPFLSVRFIFLAAIVGGPIFARNISLFLHSLGLEKQCFTFLPTVVATIWLCVLPVVSLAHIPPFNFMAANRSFGLDFDHAEMPQGAVEYMEKNEIAGRILNSFSFGQYINWTSYPKRQVFVDARGYIPVDLLEKMDARHEKDVDELEESYGFDTILYSANPSLTVGTAESTIRKMDLSFKHPDWAVVYWDDVCLLYLKRGGPYDNIVRRDEYLFVNPDMTSHVFLENLGGYDNRQRIAGELQRNIAETGSSRALLFLGILYHASNQYDKAVNAYLKVEDSFHNDFKENSYALLGDVYFKMQDYQKSLSYYKRVPGYENVPGIQHNIGKVYMNQGDSKAAAIAYEQALKIEKNTLKVYPDLINTYKSLGRVQDALNLEKQYNTLNSTQMAKMYFEEGVIAQQENRIDMAIEAYKKSLALNSDVPVIYANIGFIYLDKNQSDKAYESFNQALGLNPGFANAHYGIALFYKNKSLNEKSVYHFTKYCELEPTGYFYRKAQKEISELTK